MDFDIWWNSEAADAFRAANEDMSGEVVRPIWDAAMIAAAPKAVVKDGWMPIETAPKVHGKLLLGYVRNARIGEDDDGRYRETDTSTVDFIDWCEGGEHGDGYFMACAGPWGDHGDWITHWMPLPAAPKVG